MGVASDIQTTVKVVISLVCYRGLLFENQAHLWSLIYI